MAYLTVITGNISADFLSPPGVPAWEERKGLLLRALVDAAPDIVGLQEVTPRQYAFLHAHLRGFTACTVDPGEPTAELAHAWRAKYARYGFDTVPSPYEIVTFFRAEAFDCEATGHWWLSPTPDIASIGYGNSAPRAVLWARLRHSATSCVLTVFNTHLDHRCLDPMVGVLQRQSAPLRAGPGSLILLGDMNISPDDPLFQRLLDDGWRDSFPGSPRPAESTFLYSDIGVPAGRIDHILYQGDGLRPQSWARVESPDPPRRLSDHDPVCVRFTLVS